MKILITDSVDQRCVEVLKTEGFAVCYSPGLSIDKIIEEIRDVDALIVRSQTHVSAEIFEAGSNLKVIGRAGAGVDNIDVDAATRRGIIVLNTPGGNTISTAEHTISMMLALCRNIPQAHRSVMEGKWDRKSFIGTELYGKTLGIIGLGRVGREVARRCIAFEMKLLAYDPLQTSESAAKLSVELVDLEEIFRRSDIITIHCPLTNETKGLIGKKVLSVCKRGMLIINCARGGILDESALVDALNDGLVGGAALDVFEHEPPDNISKLVHPHLITTPHLGASTEEAQEKVAIQIAHQVADVLMGRGISGSVNADIIQIAMQKEIQPYLGLAEKIGSLLVQMMEGKLKTITVALSGRLLQDSSKAFSAAVLKGVFSKILSEPVNYLNAPIIAQERGINTRIHHDEDHDIYSHVLSVGYETDKESRNFSGTVFGNRDARIISIDGFHFEVKPQGNFIFYSNIDRPGMLAAVSSVLAKANINIAGLSLGRYSIGQQALTVIAVDNHVPNGILHEIASLNGVSGVKLVIL